MSEAEETLVVKARGGDRAAFEEMVRRTSRLTYARLYLETGDGHEAEDLTQETFMRAFRSLQNLTDPKGFRSWLHSIATNVLVDSARHRSRKKRSGVLPASSDGASHPSETLERRESLQKVLSILRSLPEDYREPLTLRYLCGLDYHTIGLQLGLSNGSLRGLLNRGLETLRNELGGCYERP